MSRRSLAAFLVTLTIAVLLPVTTLGVGASSTYDMVFPVAGPNHYSDTWGAARSGGRSHTGTDIIADKMVPIVAVAAGTVGWMHNDQGAKCCAMALEHDDGWSSWYIHMNNDTPGTDDGQGWGFAPGIAPGVHVEAGQLIGWVGDSGNAEWTVSHLHFELHLPSGEKVNPYSHLMNASVKPVPSFEPDVVPTTGDKLIAYQPASGIIFDLGGAGWTGKAVPQASLIWGGYLGANAGTDLLVYGDDSSIFNFLALDGESWTVFDSAEGTAGWSHIVPGDFDGNGVTDLLFYRSRDGLMRFYSIVEGAFLPWSDAVYGTRGWNQIIPGDFDGDGGDELLWYRSQDGVTRFYDVSPDGQLSAMTEALDGTSGWVHIPSGDFDGNGTADLLYYRPRDGLSRMYTVVEGSRFLPIGQAFYLEPGLSQIVVGDFGSQSGDEVALYGGDTLSLSRFESGVLDSFGVYLVGNELLVSTVTP